MYSQVQITVCRTKYVENKNYATELLEKYKKQVNSRYDELKATYEQGLIKLMISDEKLQKLYETSRIAEWSDWSPFDWLCLIYDLKKWVILFIKVIEIFINTDHPSEAESQMKEMGLQVFQKGAVQELLPGSLVTYIAE